MHRGINEGVPILLATTHQVWGLCQCNLLSHQNGKCGSHEPVGALWIYAIAVGAREQQDYSKCCGGVGVIHTEGSCATV